MSDALRKGWCPGALQPMAARDGLIVRLRPTGGVLPAATAHALADCAERWGSGALDLTARANLQLRGVTERTLPELLAALRDLDLLDASAAGEAVRNVVASPLAGLGIGPDIRPLVAALGARLAGDPSLHALPTKFGFIIDDGGVPSLADVDADVRFTWTGGAYAVGLGGVPGTIIGSCGAGDLVPRAVAIAMAAVSLFARTDARRMRGLVDALGTEVVARACGGVPATTVRNADERPAAVVGRRTFAGVPTLGLAAPYGALDAAMLDRAAVLAARTSPGELRLTPWRAILIPGSDEPTPEAVGFITDEADPRLAVSACVGRDGCARGTTDTRADATALAAVLPAGASLHVSGCAKGCAKPARSMLTLVGRDGRYDLVREGRAGDTPLRRGLDLAEARAAIATTMLEPA